MKISKTIVTTIELNDAERKLLGFEYNELFQLIEKAERKTEIKDRFVTLIELMETLLLI